MTENTLKIRIWILLTLCLTVSITGTRAQITNDDESIKVDTLLVNVPVIATDKAGRYVTGLKKEDFFVIEDGVRRNVDFFADEYAPMNVAVLIDTSYSTTLVLKKIKNAAREFIKILRPEDKGMIVSFDYRTTFLCELTADRKTLEEAIDKVRIAAQPGSNMNDALYSTVKEKLAAVKGRKAVIVLSDGLVGGKLVSNEKLLNLLIESDAIVYPLLYLLESNFRVTPRMAEMRRQMSNVVFGFMGNLIEATGGKIYLAESTDFKKAFQNIADELKKQYTIGFYPAAGDDGKTHRVTIEVNPPDISVRTKKYIHLNPVR